MEDLSEYLRWEAADNGAHITGCDKTFEGAMALPDHINGLPVVEIGKRAFAGCGKITSVTLPDTVEVVGEYAFYGSRRLEELRLGAGIKKIEKEAFKGCSSLRRVVLPSSLEERAPDAFDDSVDFIVDDDSLSNDDERL